MVATVLEVDVITEPKAAAIALDDLRSRILAELREPASAAMLAQRLGLPRQKVNYHLRALENHGLVEVTGKRKHGGLTERLMVATAASYVVSPAAMGASAPGPEQMRDRLSAQYLVALGARLMDEVGRMVARVGGRSRLATLAMDTEIRFAGAEDQAAFARDLAAAVTRLVHEYHHDEGRRYRLVVASHPLPKEDR